MTNTAPERIELRGGYHFVKEGSDYFIADPSCKYSNGYSASYTLEMAQAFAAAMSPAPSEGDEEVARQIVEEFNKDPYTPMGEDDVKWFSAILARHRATTEGSEDAGYIGSIMDFAETIIAYTTDRKNAKDMDNHVADFIIRQAQEITNKLQGN